MQYKRSTETGVPVVAPRGGGRVDRREHLWRPVLRYHPERCPICPTPLSCTAEIVSPFREDEYKRPAKRLAIHYAARATGWKAFEFREKLVDALREANVHFSKLRMLHDAQDLDLSPLESELDGYEIDAGKEAEALTAWIERYLLAEFTEESLPEFRDTGKERFMCVSSALIGIDPVLRERLKAIVDAEYPSPPY